MAASRSAPAPSTDNGEGDGVGANINIPLPRGGGRGAYVAAFERVVVPALERFQPEFIIVASGLDASAWIRSAACRCTPTPTAS